MEDLDKIVVSDNNSTDGQVADPSSASDTEGNINRPDKAEGDESEKVSALVQHKSDSHLVQIKASNAEILRRISAFIERKQNEVDENNRQEFCGVFPSMEVSEDSCARTEAVFVPRAGGKSHMKVTRVVNSYGPQTRALGLGQDLPAAIPKVKEEPDLDGVEERLNNIEAHLKMKGSSKTDVFSRLKVLEERVLFLESLSPEYFKSGPPSHKRQRLEGKSNTMSNQSYKDLSMSEIEDKMRALRESLLKKAEKG